MKLIPLFLLVFLAHIQPVWGSIPERDGVYCIMGEARGEGFSGMKAVAEVLRRRGTTQGMYGCKAKFTEPKWVWDLARKAWRESVSSNLSQGATMFENIAAFGEPPWHNAVVKTAIIGNHTFFKEARS